MLKAAQLALDVPGAPPQLDARDTAGTPEGAAKAAKEAIAGGAALILGPLTSSETAAVAPVAKQAGVAVLAFTNDAAQAQPGVWTAGHNAAPAGPPSGGRGSGAGQVAIRRPAARRRFRPRDVGGAAAGHRFGRSAAALYPPIRAGHGLRSTAATRDLSDYASRGGARRSAHPRCPRPRAMPRAGGRRQSLPRSSQRRAAAVRRAAAWPTPASRWPRSPRCCPITTCNRPAVRILGPGAMGRCRPADRASYPALGTRLPDPAARAGFDQTIHREIRHTGAGHRRSCLRRGLDRPRARARRAVTRPPR